MCYFPFLKKEDKDRRGELVPPVFFFFLEREISIGGYNFIDVLR